MFKSTQTSLILILINVIIINKVIASNNGRSWLYACSEGDCSDAIGNCNQKNCLGQEDCIDCVTKDSFTCRTCVNEIFNKLNLIKGQLICSINDPLQVKVCEIYCRGKYEDGGKCERDQNQISRCLCQSKDQISTEKVTEMPITTVEHERQIECKHIF
jgi:hypothetical protein